MLHGRTSPRLWTRPLRPLTPATSRGFEAVTFANDVLGIQLHPWQRWLLVHALELLEDGTFRFRTLLVLVARQNGKTTLMTVLALWRMYVDGAPLVIGTAQNLDVAEEAWQGAVDMAEGVPDLAAEIASIDRTNGKKQIRLESGERYKVAAASRRGGRGLSGDLVLLDELREHQTWAAWGAVTKTTMARARAQVWCLSNAGDSASVVLVSLRGRALADSGDLSLGIFEWSAPDGCPVEDPSAWEYANPSAGHPNGVEESAIRAALDTDPESVFRTEVLCQQVDILEPGAVDVDRWLSLADDPPTISGPSFGADLDEAGAGWTAVAWRRPDGAVHVQLDRRVSVSTLQERCDELTGRYGGLVFAGGGAAAVLDKPEVVSSAEFAAACARFAELLAEGALRHCDQAELNDAVRSVRWRSVGTAGERAWQLKDAPGVGPLAAVTRALHGLLLAPVGTGKVIGLD